MAEITFEEYVSQWDGIGRQIADLQAQRDRLTADLDAKIKDLAATELAMRKSIGESVATALGDTLKEGVNSYTMADGRVLKYTRVITRSIDESRIAHCRAEFGKLNDTPVTFDDLLRVKYELAKTEWNKLGERAKGVVSDMITTKPGAPTLEIK